MPWSFDGEKFITLTSHNQREAPPLKHKPTVNRKGIMFDNWYLPLYHVSWMVLVSLKAQELQKSKKACHMSLWCENILHACSIKDSYRGIHNIWNFPYMKANWWNSSESSKHHGCRCSSKLVAKKFFSCLHTDSIHSDANYLAKRGRSANKRHFTPYSFLLPQK